jgi:hypothetical protein
MKNYYCLFFLFFFFGCTSSTQETFYKDFSFEELKTIEKIEKTTIGGKNNNKYIEIADPKTPFNFFVFGILPNPIKVEVKIHDTISIFSIKYPDGKYVELPEYLIINAKTGNALSYFFPDNTLEVDSTINCVITNYQNNETETKLVRLKMADTIRLTNKLLTNNNIPIFSTTSSNRGKGNFPKTLLGYLSTN